METFWTVGVAAALIGNLALLLLMLGLSRELGLVLVRLGPQAPREIRSGPEPGAAAPALEVTSIDGRVRTLRPQDRKKHLVLFITPNCGMCADLIPAIPSFARAYAGLTDVSVVIMGPSDEPNQEIASLLARADIFVASDAELATEMEIQTAPFGLLVDEAGIVQSAGLVNNQAHLEALLELETFTDRLEYRRTARAGH